MHHFGVLQLGFAKWRHETISEVVCQLMPLTSFVQQGFPGVFRNTKPEGLDGACKDVELWVFVQAVASFMQEADRLRQWGSGCSCHETGLLRGQKVVCENKGMRWAGALRTKHLLSWKRRLLG